MFSSAAGLIVACAVTVVFFSNRQDKLYKFYGGDWAMGQPFIETFASGALAGKLTYKFAKWSRNPKSIGKLLNSTEFH